MKKLKVMSIFGTRPEAAKMAPLILRLNRCEQVASAVCVTAQHRELLDSVLGLFKIKPDYDLNIMRQRQTHFDIVTNVLNGMKAVFETAEPDLVLVHGDTITSFAAALSAFYMKIKVGHVEAGLRTYNKLEPFPEEMNRLLTGRLADLHFAPTALSKAALLKENVPEPSIFVTGNTGVEAIMMNVEGDYRFSVDELNGLDYANKKIIMMTAHRYENIGKPLEDICDAVLEIAENREVEVVYLVHPNPAVRDIVFPRLGGVGNVRLLDPLDLKDMHNLMKRCWLVLTDSGGLQEEAPTVGKPAVVLRNVTERPEGLDAGTLILAGTDRKNIVDNVNMLLNDRNEYDKMTSIGNPFGDGQASRRILEAILYSFGYATDPPDEF